MVPITGCGRRKIVLSSEYIMSLFNIDILYKGLINKQFGRINTFADINLKTNNNILVKMCKWADIDNRVKRNLYDSSNIHNTLRDSGKDTGRHIVRIECSLNTQKGKTLMDEIRNEWMQCLSKAVREKHKTIDSGKKIVLFKEYIMSTSNIDLLCKRLIDKQFGKINAFADIN
ncbi:hypothetical protein G9A89_020395 [Geosiphon pyriformis]|nr:hypothetical protein G9A89_020395 [Geosiphon pyriformis]